MEPYNIMAALNSFLMLCTIGLIGLVWTKMNRDQDESKEEIKKLYKYLNETLLLATKNQSSIEKNQELIKIHMEQRGIHYDLAERILELERKS